MSANQMRRWVVEREDPAHLYFIFQDPANPTKPILDGGKRVGPKDSVTKIIKEVVKPDFHVPAWYGYNMGTNAAFMAHDLGLESDDLTPISTEYPEFRKACMAYENPNRVLEKAGARGTAVHDALERWATEGKALNPSDFDEEDHKRIQGLAKFLLEHDPQIEESEVMVYHQPDNWCGQFDASVIFGAGPHKGQKFLLDWKTSKGVYKEQFYPQLSAYVDAERLCGIDYDGSAIVHIPESGKVTLHVNDEGYEEFACLLPVYHSLKNRKAREKEAKKKAKAAKT